MMAHAKGWTLVKNNHRNKVFLCEDGSRIELTLNYDTGRCLLKAFLKCDGKIVETRNLSYVSIYVAEKNATRIMYAHEKQKLKLL